MIPQTSVVIRWPDEPPRRAKRTVCVHCTSPVRKGHPRFCQAHYMEDRKQRGVCAFCSKPICPESVSRCVFHVLKQRIVKRADKLKRYQPGGPGAPPIVVPEY